MIADILETIEVTELWFQTYIP